MNIPNLSLIYLFNKRYSKQNICLICDQEKWTFEKKGIDYNFHVQNTHNVWHYVYFLIYLTKLER